MTNHRSSTKIWVIVPGYNEQRFVGNVLKKVLHKTKNIIFVDDGSSDETVQIASKYLPKNRILAHDMNLGKGSAMHTGAKYAFDVLKADAVVFMDSDDQHDPESLKKFLELLCNGSRVVLGSRVFSAETMPLTRFIGNKIASAVVSILYGKYIPDIPCGFKAFDRSVYEKLRWQSSGYEIETEIAVTIAKHKIPFEIVEIETIYHDNEKGMNVLEALRIIKALLLWRIGL